MRLIERMESEARSRVQAILDGAKKQASEIEAEVSQVAERLRKEARLATQKKLVLEKAKRASKVTLAAKKEEAETKRALLDRVFDGARKELESVSKGKDYAALFDKLADEAFKDLDGKLVVSVREGDKARAQAAVKRAGADAEVVEDLRSPAGGLVIRTKESGSLIDNTLLVRLDRSRIDGAVTAGKILFG
jgi:vacuolar-type H+-ATPase subunit E/Vma4